MTVAILGVESLAGLPADAPVVLTGDEFSAAKVRPFVEGKAGLFVASSFEVLDRADFEPLRGRRAWLLNNGDKGARRRLVTAARKSRRLVSELRTVELPDGFDGPAFWQLVRTAPLWVEPIPGPPPMPLPSPTACGFCQRESCAGDCDERKRIEARSSRIEDEGKTDAKPRRSRCMTTKDLMAEPPPEWVIEGLVVGGGVTVLAGEASTGKTFVALDMAAAVADGVAWAGCGVKQGTAVHVAFEADDLRSRVMALGTKGAACDNLRILRADSPLSPHVERDGTEAASVGEATLTEELRLLAGELERSKKPPIVLVVIDTIRASLSGSEDSSENSSAYLRSIRRILASAAPGAAMLPLHHTGWQDGEQQKKRERGSSAWRGNADGTLFLEKTGEDRETGQVFLSLKSLKLRDSERRAPIRLVRERADILELDRHGNPRSSCVIVSDTRTYESIEARKAAGQATEDAAMDLEVLRVMADHPCTSLEGVRALVRGKREAVGDSVARVLLAKLAFRTKQRDPYVVSQEGLFLLRTSRPQSAPVGPGAHSGPAQERGFESAPAPPPPGGPTQNSK